MPHPPTPSPPEEGLDAVGTDNFFWIVDLRLAGGGRAAFDVFVVIFR